VSGVNAEGSDHTAIAEGLAEEFLGEALQVLQPKRIVRVAVTRFGLYPSDGMQVMRRLRGHFYRNEHLERVLPPSALNYRDQYHAAIDFIVPESDNGTGLSAVVGAVGPPHKNVFFAVPDSERDNRWWIGFRVDRRLVNEEGFDDAQGALAATLQTAAQDYEHITRVVLGEVVN
jgi:hypothetical protein